jgi:serine/threonine protein kinase
MLHKVGEGGMGVVYKAHAIYLERFVAINVLPPFDREGNALPVTTVFDRFTRH